MKYVLYTEAEIAQLIYKHILKGIAVIITLLFLTGCSQPHPSPPPPPSALKPKPPGPARPGDMVIRNCTLTKQTNQRVDCICRHASTHIDAADTSKQSLVCR